MKNLVKVQCNVLIRQKGCIFCFLTLCIMIGINFVGNVFRYWNTELAQMPSFVNISILSDEMSLGWYIASFFPFLLVLPGGLSLAIDKNCQEDLLWTERCGRGKYMFSKVIAVLFVTFFCFFVPLMIELLLNCIAFPMSAHGNLAGNELFSDSYQTITGYYLFSIYYTHPVLYVILASSVISGMASILSLLSLAVGSFFSRYYAYLLLPVYLLLSLLSSCLASVKSFPWESDYTWFLKWCHDQIHRGDFQFMGAFLAGVAVFSFLVLWISSRRDTI